MADPTVAQINRVRRLAIGDTSDEATLSAEDIIDLWNNEGGGSDMLTAAEACDMLANRYSKSFRFSATGQTMNVNDRVKQYRAAALSLRRRYYGSGTITITSADNLDSGTEYTP